MNIIQGLLECLRGSVDDIPVTAAKRNYRPTYVSENPNSLFPVTSEQSVQIAATDAMLTLQSAEKAGDSLKTAIEDIVTQAGGWTEQIAKSILAMLQNVLKEGSPMGSAMKEAYDKAYAAANSLGEFIHDHPIFCTIIALGTLVILAPPVINALGFCALGPVEGSFAAAWQSLYGGLVESGSLFSYLQKLGMLYG